MQWVLRVRSGIVQWTGGLLARPGPLVVCVVGNALLVVARHAALEGNLQVV